MHIKGEIKIVIISKILKNLILNLIQKQENKINDPNIKNMIIFIDNLSLFY